MRTLQAPGTTVQKVGLKISRVLGPSAAAIPCEGSTPPTLAQNLAPKVRLGRWLQGRALQAPKMLEAVANDLGESGVGRMSGRPATARSSSSSGSGSEDEGVPSSRRRRDLEARSRSRHKRLVGEAAEAADAGLTLLKSRAATVEARASYDAAVTLCLATLGLASLVVVGASELDGLGDRYFERRFFVGDHA